MEEQFLTVQKKTGQRPTTKMKYTNYGPNLEAAGLTRIPLWGRFRHPRAGAGGLAHVHVDI